MKWNLDDRAVSEFEIQFVRYYKKKERLTTQSYLSDSYQAYGAAPR
jgi:hypothetical protein